MEKTMFEALRWRNESAMRHAVHSLAQAGKTPLVIGSIAAMAVVGVLATMGLNHKGRGRSKATVIPARFRSAIENAVSSAPSNGRRRKRRKMKAAAQKTAAH
jgi:hypothetical protein